MEAITFDLFLLITGLILVCIILFLSLVSVIYTVRLAYKMDTLTKMIDIIRPVPKVEYPIPSVEKKVESGDSGISAKETVSVPEIPKFDPVRDAPDIPSGMQRLCEIYGIESLTLSTPDGLVVASTGHPLAGDDAARVSYASMTGNPVNESGVSVFHTEYKGNDLVGIIRGNKEIPEDLLGELKKDISSLLERWI
ncbi:MAG: hypothetical protein QHH04_08755 [Methanolinea sp.]|jgi:hypothetical protein|nr:hypothetical protein [Methanolinea sp.]